MNKPLECLKSEYSHEKPWQGKHCCIKTEEEDFVHDYGNMGCFTRLYKEWKSAPIAK